MCVLLILILNFFVTVLSIKDMIYVNTLCDLPSAATHKQCYVKEVLAAIVHSPNQLAVDKSNDTLYFSFDSGQGEYWAAVLNLDNKKIAVLKGVKDAFAIANDPANNDIYFGGSHGIYKYDPNKSVLKQLRVNNLDIWWLVVKKRLYFIRFPSLRAYYYEDKIVKVIPELKNYIVNQFVFDNDENVMFLNSSGLYGIKHGDDKVVLVKDYPKFLSIAADHKGLVYLSNENGIYVIGKMVQKVKKIVDIPGVLGMTFDKDNNIIYSDSYELVRLKLVPKIKV